MNLRCSYCQTPFTLGRVEKLGALQHMEAEKLTHYDAHCPRCRRAAPVPRFKLEATLPNWRDALKELEKEMTEHPQQEAPLHKLEPAPAPQAAPAPQPKEEVKEKKKPAAKEKTTEKKPAAKPKASTAKPASEKAKKTATKPAAKKPAAKKTK